MKGYVKAIHQSLPRPPKEAAQRPRIASATMTLGLTSIGIPTPMQAFPLGILLGPAKRL
jgi:hypothetical protein